MEDAPRSSRSPRSTIEKLKERRGHGLRVGPRLLTSMMKKNVDDQYGREAMLLFKASKTWRAKLARRWGISLKRRSNKKSISAEERLPKVRAPV